MKNKATFGLSPIIWESLKANAARQNVSVRDYVKKFSDKHYISINKDWVPINLEHSTNHYIVTNVSDSNNVSELSFLRHHGLNISKLYKSNC